MALTCCLRNTSWRSRFKQSTLLDDFGVLPFKEAQKRFFFLTKVDLHEAPFPNTDFFYPRVPLPQQLCKLPYLRCRVGELQQTRPSEFNPSHAGMLRFHSNMKSCPCCVSNGTDLSLFCHSLYSVSVPFDYNTG